MKSRDVSVAVVEDDSGLRQALERILRAAGYSARLYESAEDYLRDEGEPPACLILDVHLPEASGFELRRRLAMSGSLPPVIFITAHDTESSRAQAAQAGAAAYLPKPFAGRVLLEAVTAAMSGLDR
jgi:FixJ family two-component response regulator